MKKATIIIAVFMSMLSLSCSMNREDIGTDFSCPVRVEFHATDGKTKAAASDDSAINNFAVWLYAKGSMASGKRALYFGYAEKDNLSLECEPGEYDIFAAVNMPDGKLDLNNLDNNLDFNVSREYVLLNDMTAESLCGTASVTRTLSDGDNVALVIRRRMAKISIDKITNSISGGRYAGKDITFKGVFIENGVGRINFDCSSVDDVSGWFSCSGFYEPGQGSYPDFGQLSPPALSYEFTSGPKIPSGSSYRCSSVLYTGANPVSHDCNTGLSDLSEGSSWELRKTRVVIRCEIDGTMFYYPLTINSIAANSWYSISEISIRQQGSRSPDVPVSFQDVKILGKVTDWEGIEIHETI